MNDLQRLAKDTMTRARTTPDAVAVTLREAIVRGILRAAQPLRADDIATQLGVSHIPVREALRQLEGEGLVTIYPNRGAVVSALSRADITEIYGIRATLEASALRHAVPRLTKAALRRASALLDEYELETDTRRWGELDLEFHATLYGLEDRPRLLGIINTLRNQVDRYFHVFPLAVKQRTAFQRDHRAILESCASGDVDDAVRHLEKHLERTANVLLEGMPEATTVKE
jgi:DNA-binding GntR family transcriptional regulator